MVSKTKERLDKLEKTVNTLGQSLNFETDRINYIVKSYTDDINKLRDLLTDIIEGR